MDQDDSMISSPPSPADQDESTFTHPDEDQDQDQDLFPPSTTLPANTIPRPQTPQNNHLNAAAPGELSPPRSQDQTHPHPPQPPHTTTVPSRNRAPNNTSSRMTPTTNDNPAAGGTSATGGTAEYTPGFWKTAKSQDEMTKVWETSYVDRDFNGAIFGDPLSHVVPAATGQQNGGSGGDAAGGMAVFRGALGL